MEAWSVGVALPSPLAMAIEPQHPLALLAVGAPEDASVVFSAQQLPSADAAVLSAPIFEQQPPSAA